MKHCIRHLQPNPHCLFFCMHYTCHHDQTNPVDHYGQPTSSYRKQITFIANKYVCWSSYRCSFQTHGPNYGTVDASDQSDWHRPHCCWPCRRTLTKQCRSCLCLILMTVYLRNEAVKASTRLSYHILIFTRIWKIAALQLPRELLRGWIVPAQNAQWRNSSCRLRRNTYVQQIITTWNLPRLTLNCGMIYTIKWKLTKLCLRCIRKI